MQRIINKTLNLVSNSQNLELHYSNTVEINPELSLSFENRILGGSEGRNSFSGILRDWVS